MITLRQIIRNQGVTNKVIADALGIESTNIGRYDDLSKRRLSELIIISKALDMSLGDLVQQAMADEIELGDVTIINKPKYIERIDEEGIINLYDIEAAANLKSLLVNKDQNILGKISIPNIPKCDGAVYVKGDSMYPLLKSGDIIGYKEISSFDNVIYGEIYLVSFMIDGDEYLAVKYVNRSEKEGYLKLVSYNTHHEPMDIPFASINAMAIVKFSIRRHMMM